MITKAEITFYNNSTDVVLTETFADGHKRHTMFDAVAPMVNHCREHGIDVPFENIHTV
jgi:hypothetical protein